MKIERYGKTIRSDAKPGTNKAHKAAPANFNAAARNAVRIAKRDGEEVALIPGNSYGSAVWHIARVEGTDLARFGIVGGWCMGATATPEGLVRHAAFES